MVRKSRNLNMIEIPTENLDAAVSYMEKRGDVAALYLYGSYRTEYQTVFSDVDFAVLPFSKLSMDYVKEYEILSELQHICENEDISLVNLLKVPLTLQMRVLESGRLLYCRDKIHLADFKEYVIKRYCDFEPDLRGIYRDYDAGLREEYL